MESQEYQLDRQSTAHKKAGDWGAAITALQERKRLMGLQYDDVKLAKYLQAAGRFDEAVVEINWLVDTSAERAKVNFSHQPPTVILMHKVQRLSQIYGAGMLICERAKRLDIKAEFELKRDAYRNLLQKIDPIAQADRATLTQKMKSKFEQITSRIFREKK